MVNFVMLLFAGIFADTKEQEHTGGFVTDPNGKYVVFQEEKKEFESDIDLQDYVLDFFDEKEVEIEKENTQRVKISGKTMLKRHAGIGNYIAGDLNYNMTFEKTPDGYRYWFTDLSYQPYVKDRYGKIVPANAKPIPLEKEMSKINKGVWKKQREFAFQTMNDLAGKLNDYLGRVDAPKVIAIN